MPSNRVSLEKSPEDPEEGHVEQDLSKHAQRSREAKQKEESSCLFDGAIKGLFMFISHLKRSHKTSDCAHKPSAAHKSCREARSAFENHLDSDTRARNNSMYRKATAADNAIMFERRRLSVLQLRRCYKSL